MSNITTYDEPKKPKCCENWPSPSCKWKMSCKKAQWEIFNEFVENKQKEEQNLETNTDQMGA